jgi:hypothetical protein
MDREHDKARKQAQQASDAEKYLHREKLVNERIKWEGKLRNRERQSKTGPGNEKTIAAAALQRTFARFATDGWAQTMTPISAHEIKVWILVTGMFLSCISFNDSLDTRSGNV